MRNKDFLKGLSGGKVTLESTWGESFFRNLNVLISAWGKVCIHYSQNDEYFYEYFLTSKWLNRFSGNQNTVKMKSKFSRYVN